MKSILFVDDDARLLAGVQRMLWPARGEWNMTFCSTPEHAVERMHEQSYGVIVSDMRMPGMDGAELLKKAQKLQPACVRIILSGQTSHEAILRSIRPAH